MDLWGAVGGTTHLDNFSDFMNGKVVFYFGGSWSLFLMDKTVGDAFDWAVVDAPCGTAGCVLMPGGGAMVGLQAHAASRSSPRGTSPSSRARTTCVRRSRATPNIPVATSLVKSGVDYPNDSERVRAALAAFTRQVPNVPIEAYTLPGLALPARGVERAHHAHQPDPHQRARRGHRARLREEGRGPGHPGLGRTSRGHGLERPWQSRSWVPWLFLLPNLVDHRALLAAAGADQRAVLGDRQRQPLSRASARSSGCENFATLLECGNYLDPSTCSRDLFWRAVGNAIVFVPTQVAVMIGFALATAIALNRDIRARGFFRGIFFFPVMLSPVVVAMTWVWLLQRTARSTASSARSASTA